MSSVVIAGNTSGSITLSAPAISGTNTITLPAETGTLVTTATSTGISGSAITTGTVGVSVGGTGVTTTTAYGVLAGGTTATGAFQNIGTGTTNQVLTSNGPGVLPSFQTLVSGGQLQTQLFTAPGTWTKPASATQVRVTVIGGGGGGGQIGPGTCFPGGSGGVSYALCPVSAPVAVTVGTGGAGSGANSFVPGSAGNTSSFGALATATGGPAGPGGGGAGSTTGTLLRNSNVDGGVYINMYTNTNRQAAGSRSPVAFSTAGTFGAGNYGTGIPTTNTQSGGVDGIVLVEFVG